MSEPAASARPPFRFLLVAVVAALALVVAACGDDDDSSSDDAGGDGATEVSSDDAAYVSAFAASIAEDPGSPFSAEDATCISAAVVDIVGGASFFAGHDISVDDVGSRDDSVLAEIGFKPTDEQATDFGTRFVDCGISMGELIGAGMAASGGGDVSDDFVDCVDEQFDAAVIGEIFLADDDAAEDSTVDAALACAHLLEL